MSLPLEIALKSAVVFLVALVATTALRRYSAALRHFVLAASFVCVAVIPFLTEWAPAWRVGVPHSWFRVDTGTPLTFTATSPPSTTAVAASSAVHPSGPSPGASPVQIVLVVWFAGVFISIASACVGMWRIGQFARRAHLLRHGAWRERTDEIGALYGIRRPVQLLQSAHPTMLVTWGLRRSRILLPLDASEWSDDRIRVVLYHELAHVHRCDWAVLIGARLLRAIYWFNPLAWIAFRRLRQESERACDDVVLSRGIGAADYASHLLEVARHTVLHRNWSTATAIAHPSTLEGRIRAMLNEQVDRAPLTMRERWSAVTVAIGSALLIAGAGVSVLASPDPAPPSIQAPSAAVTSLPADGVGRVDHVNASVPPASQRPAVTRSLVEAPAAAQAQPGAFAGVLYDQLGGVLPGVQVRLLNQNDGAKYDTTSDRNGAFLFTALPAGDYQLTTSLPGFATVSNLIKIVSGATVERAVTLPIGTIQETISVTGGAGPRIASSPRAASGGQTRTAPEPRTFFSGGIGGQIRVPNKIAHVSPVYPADVAGVSDAVKLTGRIGIDGFISDLHEVSPAADAVAASHPAFVASALDAVSQWEFTPVLLNNVPVEAQINITVYYSVQ